MTKPISVFMLLSKHNDTMQFFSSLDSVNAVQSLSRFSVDDFSGYGKEKYKIKEDDFIYYDERERGILL